MTGAPLDRSASGDGTRPERCLSFTVRGPWGHFRRVEGNVVKQTYRIVPRTTVAGLIAAVLGIDRDGYYDLFGPESSAVAVQPTREIRTVNMPMNTLSTADGDLQSLNSYGKIGVQLPDPTTLRQQHNYEVLVDPEYRIDVALADETRYRQLEDALSAGKSHYVPSLGLSEHLAEIDYHGEFDVDGDESAGVVEVDSAVPDAIENVKMEPETRCSTEQSPAFMTTDGGGRTTTAFTSYAYNPDAEPLKVDVGDRLTPATVGDRTVVFV